MTNFDKAHIKISQIFIIRLSNVPAIALVKRYLDHHNKEDISLKHLADMVYMNPSYFSHYFTFAFLEVIERFIIIHRRKETPVS